MWMATGKGSASTNALLVESSNLPQLWSDMDGPFLLLLPGTSHIKEKYCESSVARCSCLDSSHALEDKGRAMILGK